MRQRLPFRALGLGNGIAQFPEGFGLGLIGGEGRILDQPLAKRFAKPGFELAGQAACGIGAGRFDEHVPAVLALKRRARARNMLEHQLERIVGHQFKALDRLGAGFEEAEQLKRLHRAVGPGPGHRPACDRRHQPKRNGSDHAQRPFGADQQLVEAVAAIVLLQARQAVMDGAVGKHRFDPGDERAHRPEAKHLGAAGIGRGEPADGAAAARTERQREAQPLVVDRVVEGFEHHPRLGHRHPRGDIDRANPVHPPKRQQQRRTVFGRGRAGAHAGIAPLRHQGDPVLGGKVDNRRDLLGRGWRKHRRRRP